MGWQYACLLLGIFKVRYGESGWQVAFRYILTQSSSSNSGFDSSEILETPFWEILPSCLLRLFPHLAQQGIPGPQTAKPHHLKSWLCSHWTLSNSTCPMSLFFLVLEKKITRCFLSMGHESLQYLFHEKKSFAQFFC